MCTLANYIHFFGVVSTCAYFATLIFASIRANGFHLRNILFIGLAFAFVVFVSLGLTPFIIGSAVPHSNENEGYFALSRFFGFFMRLFGDTANFVPLFPATLYFAGAVILACAGAISAFSRLRQGVPHPLDWLYTVVITGIAAPLLAWIIIRSFDPTKVAYNNWLFAPLCIVIGIGATTATGPWLWRNALRPLAVGTMLLGSAWTTNLFFSHVSMYVHGPQRFVSNIFDDAENPKAIIYGDGDSWFYCYFPLEFTQGGRIAQFRSVGSGGEVFRLGQSAQISQVQPVELVAASYKELLLVNVFERRFDVVRHCQADSRECPQISGGELEARLLGSGQWREIKDARSFGVIDAQIKVLDKITDSSAEPK